MQTERSKQLVYELDAFYRASRMRQKDLASALDMSPQQLSEILALRNRPTGEQVLTIASFLKDKNMPTITKRSLATRAAALDDDDDDPPVDAHNGVPSTLYQATLMVEQLRSELKQAKSAPAVIHAPAPLVRVIVPAPAPASAADKPAAPTAPKTAPAVPQSAWEREVARAHQAATANLSDKPLAEQSILQLTSALNAEKDSSKKFEIYAQLKQRKREAKMAAGDAAPFDPEKDVPNFVKVEQTTAPIPKRLPTDADTPVLIQKILDVTNFEDLVSMLSNPAHSQLQRACIYAEVRMRRGIVPNPE